MVFAHLLQDLDEETNLNLSRLLQQSIQRCGTFSLAQHAKPLFDSTQFILEILVKSGGSHFLQSGLVLVNISNPLLSNLVLRVGIKASLTMALLGLTIKIR